MRPSRSLAAGAERAPIRIQNAKSQFERGLTFSRHALEFRDEVSPEGELRALDAGSETREAPAARDALAIEGRRVVQGRVVANLRPEVYRLEQRRSLRNRWRDVEAAGDLEIGGGRGGEDRRVEEAVLEVDEVEITGVGGHKEVTVVAPKLDTSNGLQPVVDGVDDVLRPAIAARLDPAIVVDVVEIGDEGPGGVDLPCGRDGVEIAQRVVGTGPMWVVARIVRLPSSRLRPMPPWKAG